MKKLLYIVIAAFALAFSAFALARAETPLSPVLIVQMAVAPAPTLPAVEMDVSRIGSVVPVRLILNTPMTGIDAAVARYGNHDTDDPLRC